jgi:hypothetical protein
MVKEASRVGLDLHRNDLGERGITTEDDEGEERRRRVCRQDERACPGKIRRFDVTLQDGRSFVVRGISLPVSGVVQRMAPDRTIQTPAPREVGAIPFPGAHWTVYNGEYDTLRSWIRQNPLGEVKGSRGEVVAPHPKRSGRSCPSRWGDGVGVI